MKAIIVREYGGPEKLSYEEQSEPEAEKSRVLVKIKACSVNRRDVWTRMGQGLKIPLPFIPGGDLAGEVVRVGPQVERYKVGDRVIAYPRLPCGKCEYCLSGKEDLCTSTSILLGAYADLISLPEVTLLQMPQNMSYDVGASIPIDFVTAWNLLVTIGEVSAGDTVLVYAGGSGLG
ncbi:MAG: alcohol dehydrogenase catalytic domain-containing protein, partial [Nitrososphaerales archaeon]